ncbi:hypothetical protein FS749_005753, partial [Ceratobasidium sp. UAMH 11750]
MIAIHNVWSGVWKRNKSRPGDNQALSPPIRQEIPTGRKYLKDVAGGEPEKTQNGQLLDLPLEIFNK